MQEPRDRIRGARERRFASVFLDFAFLAAPWAGGAAHYFSIGALFFCPFGSITIFSLNVVLFLSKGRTLGMAVTGIHAEGGRRWLSLLLDAVLVGLSFGLPYLLLGSLSDAGLVPDRVASTLMPFAVAAAFAGNFVVLLAPSRRTLTHRLSALCVVRDGIPTPAATRAGAYLVDATVVLACVVPALVVGGSAASAGAVVLCLLVLLESSLWVRTRASLGMRALGLG